MKKTYITTMPDHIGAFLKASELFEKYGVNITRVSYNKAIDSHTLFIDAEGDEAQLGLADRKLEEIGYLQTAPDDTSIVLLEFTLRDVPGSVSEVLRVIHRYELNISYISSQENGSEYQAFKMGLFVDSEERLREFMAEVQQICPVRVLDYNHSERVFDNSIFYQSFVSGLMELPGLPDVDRNVLLVNSNLVMQMLDEKGMSPFKTFESISRFAELLSLSKGDAFAPRISVCTFSSNTRITLIEPSCGSNTAIIESLGEVLFVDSGYALYEDEMVALFRRLLPGFDDMRKRIFVTHADVDHCGLLPLFDEIIASRQTCDCLTAHYNGEDGFREKNPLHKPYVRICKAVTGYRAPDASRLVDMWGGDTVEPAVEKQRLLQPIGFLDVGEMHFDVFRGAGGHLPGETVLIDYDHHVAFTGDIYVNVHGMTREQAEYNRYAPVLMTSVDTDPVLCTAERAAIMQRLGAGEWKIFGAHGSVKDYSLGVKG